MKVEVWDVVDKGELHFLLHHSQKHFLFSACWFNVVLSAHLTLTSGQKYPLPECAGEPHPGVEFSLRAVLGPVSLPFCLQAFLTLFECLAPISCSILATVSLHRYSAPNRIEAR